MILGFQLCLIIKGLDNCTIIKSKRPTIKSFITSEKGWLGLLECDGKPTRGRRIELQNNRVQQKRGFSSIPEKKWMLLQVVNRRRYAPLGKETSLDRRRRSGYASCTCYMCISIHVQVNSFQTPNSTLGEVPTFRITMYSQLFRSLWSLFFLLRRIMAALLGAVQRHSSSACRWAPPPSARYTHRLCPDKLRAV